MCMCTNAGSAHRQAVRTAGSTHRQAQARPAGGRARSPLGRTRIQDTLRPLQAMPTLVVGLAGSGRSVSRMRVRALPALPRGRGRHQGAAASAMHAWVGGWPLLTATQLAACLPWQLQPRRAHMRPSVLPGAHAQGVSHSGWAGGWVGWKGHLTEVMRAWSCSPLHAQLNAPCHPPHKPCGAHHPQLTHTHSTQKCLCPGGTVKQGGGGRPCLRACHSLDLTVICRRCMLRGGGGG